MIAPPHLTLGAAIGAYLFRFSSQHANRISRAIWLIVILFLGILSHYLLDGMRHAEYNIWGSYDNIFFILDLVIFIPLIFIVGVKKPYFGFYNLAMVTGMTGAAFPDGISIVKDITGIRIWGYDTNGYIHSYLHHLNSPMFFSMADQYVLSFLFLFALAMLRKKSSDLYFKTAL